MTESFGDFKEKSHVIKSIYMGNMTYHSITLDLMALYLKGQKFLYVESKTFCESCLYRLMLPTIFISAACTVLSIGLAQYKQGPIIVSSLTGFNSFLLSVVTYLKLDAKAEAHKTSAYQFDKLQTSCEFYSGKALMLKDPKVVEKIGPFLDDIEKKVTELKDVNQFVIPEIIRYKYADIYSFNVFAVMKKYTTTRLINTQHLINLTKAIDEYKEPEVAVDMGEVVSNVDLRNESDTDVETRSMKMYKSVFGERQCESHCEDLDGKLLIDIYAPTVTKDQLLLERDRIVSKILEYRNVSIVLNEKFDRLLAKTIQKENQCSPDLMGWLKN